LREREDGEEKYRKESNEVKSVTSSCSEHKIDCEKEWKEEIVTERERERERKKRKEKKKKKKKVRGKRERSDGVVDTDG